MGIKVLNKSMLIYNCHVSIVGDSVSFLFYWLLVTIVAVCYIHWHKIQKNDAFIKKVCENFPWRENCLRREAGLVPFAHGDVICCIYLAQHIRPWQKQGKVAGCLWHKRPEPGLDPFRLWEKKKKKNVRRGWCIESWTLAEEKHLVPLRDIDVHTGQRRCVFVGLC